MFFDRDKYISLSLSSLSTVWQTLLSTLLTILFNKFSHIKLWVSLSATMFLGQTAKIFSKLASKISHRLGILHWTKSFLGTPDLLFTNKTFIHSLMEYCSLSSALAPRLTVCSTWCRGNQDFQDYWNLPRWRWLKLNPGSLWHRHDGPNGLLLCKISL